MKKEKKKDFREEKLVKELEQWIYKVSPIVVEALQLGAINVYVHNKIEASDNKTTIVFSMKYSHRYKALHIRYHREALNFFSDDMSKLVSSLIHEFAHVITEPLSDIAQERYASEEKVLDAIESVTEHISILVRDQIKKNNPQILIK